MRWPWVRRSSFEVLQADCRLVSAELERQRQAKQQLESEAMHLRQRLDAYDAAVYRRGRELDEAAATLVEAMESGKVVAIAAWRSSRMVA